MPHCSRIGCAPLLQDKVCPIAHGLSRPHCFIFYLQRHKSWADYLCRWRTVVGVHLCNFIFLHMLIVIIHNTTKLPFPINFLFWVGVGVRYIWPFIIWGRKNWSLLTVSVLCFYMVRVILGHDFVKCFKTFFVDRQRAICRMLLVFSFCFQICFGYIFLSGLLSFVFIYHHGPIRNSRTLDLIRWTMQAAALVFIYEGTQIPEASAAIVLLVMFVYMCPKMTPSWMLKFWWVIVWYL